MTEEKKENRGGKREGAGPPFKYGELTSNITLRVPNSKKDDVRKLVREYLRDYVVKRDRSESKGGYYGC
jgi:hypothetical protein